MKSTHPAVIALRGMPSCWAVPSWANVIPLADLIAASPRVPSVPVPERMTPTARWLPCSANERRNASTGRCWPGVSCRGSSRKWPSVIIIVRFGGMT